ncbi:uncharacterized protein LOC107324314 isoform X3 [Coturnix japonica]|uniref:uncharacterized protein LOC107324314 isoform X3 n=1 Tax=Coturnix japonica TaxID=93934 RepID=UPI0013A5D2F4|nr:uncharacterized protein LOC107324314 isoform X3 [Coturnix japonica]
MAYQVKNSSRGYSGCWIRGPGCGQGRGHYHRQSLGQISRQNLQQISRQSLRQISRQSPRQMSRQSLQQISRQSLQQISKQSLGQMSRQSLQQISRQNLQQISKQSLQQISKQSLQQISKQSLQQISRQCQKQRVHQLLQTSHVPSVQAHRVSPSPAQTCSHGSFVPPGFLQEGANLEVQVSQQVVLKDGFHVLSIRMRWMVLQDMPDLKIDTTVDAATRNMMITTTDTDNLSECPTNN